MYNLFIFFSSYKYIMSEQIPINLITNKTLSGLPKERRLAILRSLMINRKLIDKKLHPKYLYDPDKSGYVKRDYDSQGINALTGVVGDQSDVPLYIPRSTPTMNPVIHSKTFTSTNPRNEPFEPAGLIPLIQPVRVQPAPPPKTAAALATSALDRGNEADSDDDLLDASFGPIMPRPAPAPALVPLVTTTTTTTTTPTPQPQVNIELHPQSIVETIENDIVDLSGAISKEFGMEKSNLAVEISLDFATRELAYDLMAMGYSQENAFAEANSEHRREQLKQKQLFLLHKMSSDKEMMKKLTRVEQKSVGQQNTTFSKKKTSETHVDISNPTLQHMKHEEMTSIAKSFGIKLPKSATRQQTLSLLTNYAKQHNLQ
jgi:hypothetical protein